MTPIPTPPLAIGDFILGQETLKIDAFLKNINVAAIAHIRQTEYISRNGLPKL